ncbi:hypothetical protein H4F46_05705 [Pectobacterium brasiliense]|nr:hypothetical protein [Pectobacterium brasiliense]
MSEATGFFLDLTGARLIALVVEEDRVFNLLRVCGAGATRTGFWLADDADCEPVSSNTISTGSGGSDTVKFQRFNNDLMIQIYKLTNIYADDRINPSLGWE